MAIRTKHGLHAKPTGLATRAGVIPRRKERTGAIKPPGRPHHRVPGTVVVGVRVSLGKTAGAAFMATVSSDSAPFRSRQEDFFQFSRSVPFDSYRLEADWDPALPRHRSLAASLAWSYDLLEPEDQRTLRALGVFQGSFSIAAANAVAGAGAETRVAELVRRGHGHRILISHDIALKHHLETYGGHGYAHLLRRVVPRMPEVGLTEQDIDRILRGNPAQVLARTAQRRQ